MPSGQLLMRDLNKGNLFGLLVPNWTAEFYFLVRYLRKQNSRFVKKYSRRFIKRNFIHYELQKKYG